MTWNVSDKEFAKLLNEMTVEEKVTLVTGYGLWRTAANYRLNIPEILMTDGTYGVRYSVEQIDGPQDPDSQMAAFLSVVNTDLSNGIESIFGSTRPATCFPNGSAFACSWDVGLAYEMGAALAAECQAFGVNILLGPGINIRRTLVAGRSYEYFSEDPVVTGEIAAALINGMQDGGVGASLKHFACNNSEIQRTTMSSDVDERALREIYLAGFERTIRKSNPWTVMSSYNLINGVQAAENEWLLTQVLRKEWGYDGVVVSDWHGIKNRPASLNAGNDLDMPESAARAQSLLDAVRSGEVTAETLDASCLRMLKLVRTARAGAKKNFDADFQKHHALAQRIAAQSVVLLKNENKVLPIDGNEVRRIVVIGAAAREPVIQGSGCATTRPTEVDIPFDEIGRMAPMAAIQFYAVHDFDGPDGARALEDVDAADVILFFGNTEIGFDGEDADRTHLALQEGQDDLIALLSKRQKKLAVILAMPDAVVMPWLGETSAVLATFFSGQGFGRGVAEVLFGLENPSGKLTVTFPHRLEDTPGFLTYPGEGGRHHYSEGIHVGYRYYDKRRMEPLFPFGFGLSYTTFEYANLSIDADRIDDSSVFKVSFDLTNTGPVAGKEIAQVYTRVHKPRLIRPLRELKGFAKVELQPGQTVRVDVKLEARDLRYYDAQHGEWFLDAGTLTVGVGASSRDIRLEQDLEVTAAALPSSILTMDTQSYVLLETDIAKTRFKELLHRHLDLGEAETARMMEYCLGSFLGIYNTVSWVVGDRISAKDFAEFLDGLNREMATTPTKAA